MPGRPELVRALYRTGWRLAGRLPDRLARGTARIASRIAVWHGGAHLQTLRRNLRAVSGRPVDDALLRAAVRSYLRNTFEMLALPSWSKQRVLDQVTTVNEEALRTAYAGPGAVVALPHSGNWDLAGAWACLSGMPVTTVAERLGDADYADFVAFREGLGMQVLSHDDPGVISDLAAAVKAGRLVCLVADRDLAGTGLEVSWGGHRLRMPAGPALVARRTGATLLPAVCHYTDTGMTIVFGLPVPARPGRAGLQQMTQEVADFFAATIARHPVDWHLLQPFFAQDAA